jgi:hypothetical protein
VFEGGLVESGTDDELVGLDGKYVHLFRLQSEGYTEFNKKETDEKVEGDGGLAS